MWIALKEAGERIAIYQLTIKLDAPFAALHGASEMQPPDEDPPALSMLHAHGQLAYEISNHARPGSECRHSLVYWRGREYAGIGTGAHGRLDIGSQQLA